MERFAPPACTIIGHAIVSADGMIADAAGEMPPALRSDVDWRRFQEALDQSAIVVLGREGHERHPAKGRRRLVFTSAVRDMASDPNDPRATFFNPAGMAFAELCRRLGLESGTIAVTGGTRVFDYFQAHYDSFVLVEANGLVLPTGRPCFSAGHPRAVLATAGLEPASVEMLEEDRKITSTLWHRR